jgi:hypothetical protein
MSYIFTLPEGGFQTVFVAVGLDGRNKKGPDEPALF